MQERIEGQHALAERVARLEGAFEQMNKRLARIEAEILIVLATMIAQLGGMIALLLRSGGIGK